MNILKYWGTRYEWDKYWCWLLLDLKMGILTMTLHILLLCSHSLSAFACDVIYTMQPSYGNRCVASSNTEVSLWQTDRPQCVWKCLKLKTCRYINHNHGTGQCDLGLDKCESLIPAVGIAVNAFGPPRDTCVRWGSRQEHGRVPVELQNSRIIYLARITTDDALVVGKFHVNPSGQFWANNEGVPIGPVYETDRDIEFLTMEPTCTLPWMPYTAGGILPDGAISGGHLPDGSVAYVSKVTHNDLLAFGYYNTKTQLVYYEMGGAKTKASMEILVLLWKWIFPVTWARFCFPLIWFGNDISSCGFAWGNFLHLALWSLGKFCQCNNPDIYELNWPISKYIIRWQYTNLVCNTVCTGSVP